MCYKIIKESDLSEMSLIEIEDLVKSIPTKLLGDLKYYDLYQPEYSCKGLYFIESPDGLELYIGKASSRCVGDRISAHLDSRVPSMLNSLPKKVFRHNNQSAEITNEILHDVLDAMRNWKVSVLLVESNNSCSLKSLINKVESLLILDLQPPKGNCINSTKRTKVVRTDVPIKTIL